MKWLDLPPVWLAGFLALGWAIARGIPALTLDAGWLGVAGGALIAAGLMLMLLAVIRMRRARTTVIPHRQPSALVTKGVFRLSRNPIYLGDALILTGAILWWGAVLALPLIPAFVWLITLRYIRPEEERLRAGFDRDFADWCDSTRRWL